MKLFENTQQHVSEVNLEKLKDTAMESLRESSRYVETYNDTITAIGLLKRLEAQGDSNSPVIQLAYESINDQLGYEEGTRLSVEQIVGPILTDFGKRMWEKVLAAWESVKEWSTSVIDRFRSGGPATEAEKSKEKDVRLHVLNPSLPSTDNGEFERDMGGDKFIPNMVDFINNSTNLKEKGELLKLTELITKGLVMTKQLPNKLESLYAVGKKGDTVGDIVIEVLRGMDTRFTFPTITKIFDISKDTINATGKTLNSRKGNWFYKESTADDYSTEILKVNSTAEKVVEILSSHKEFSAQLAPVINEISEDVKVYGRLVLYIGFCNLNMNRLRNILKASLGVKINQT